MTSEQSREREKIEKRRLRGEAALSNTVAQAINAAMRAEGGQPVRFRLLESGKTQFWVVRGNAQTVTAEKLVELGSALNVRMPLGRGAAAHRNPATISEGRRLVVMARAAKITGYSSTTLKAAVQRGELTCYRMRVRPKGQGQHSELDALDRDAVEAWAAEHRKKGGLFLPRRRSKRANGTVTPPPTRTTTTRDRLAAYLRRFEGTPLATTPEQFIDRLVSEALERMKS